MADIYAKMGKDKIFCHYFIFLLKNKNKDRLHITNTHRAGRYGQKNYHDNFFHISRYP